MLPWHLPTSVDYGVVCDPFHPLAAVQPLSASSFRPTAVATHGVCLTAAEPRCQELAGLPPAAATALCVWGREEGMGMGTGAELASFLSPSLAPSLGSRCPPLHIFSPFPSSLPSVGCAWSGPYFLSSTPAQDLREMLPDQVWV